jgi:Spherulation-specific family 4
MDRRQNGRIRGAITLLVLLFAFLPTVAMHLPFSTVPTADAATQQQSLETGFMIPLYAYPTDPSWSGLIQAKEAYPNVPVVAIIDPTSTGPGRSSDPNFASGIAKLQAAGIIVLGYIDTDFTSESLSTVEAWTADYKNWYDVNGIFFDCMTETSSGASYYSSADSYANSLGLNFNVGNPGTNVPPSYIGTVNVINVYEANGYPSASSIQSASMGYSRTNFAIIVTDVSAPSQSYFQSVIPYVSYVFFTDQRGGNSYMALPSYLSTLMSMLSSVDGSGGVGSTTTITTSSPTASSITTTSSSSSSTGTSSSRTFTTTSSSSSSTSDDHHHH